MKVLLDENIPRKFKFRLSDFDVWTAQNYCTISHHW